MNKYFITYFKYYIYSWTNICILLCDAYVHFHNDCRFKAWKKLIYTERWKQILSLLLGWHSLWIAVESDGSCLVEQINIAWAWAWAWADSVRVSWCEILMFFNRETNPARQSPCGILSSSFYSETNQQSLIQILSFAW